MLGMSRSQNILHGWHFYLASRHSVRGAAGQPFAELSPLGLGDGARLRHVGVHGARTRRRGAVDAVLVLANPDDAIELRRLGATRAVTCQAIRLEKRLSKIGV